MVVTGAALAIGALLMLGPSRFTVTSDGGITGTCASVFNGQRGDMGNADDGAQARQLAELRGPCNTNSNPAEGTTIRTCVPY
jgi:hypothetical protein